MGSFAKKALAAVARIAGTKAIGLSERLQVSRAEVMEKNGNWLICRAGGNIWRLDPTQYLDGQILKYGVFEPESTRLVHHIVKEGMTILDVGANFGYYTVQFSKLVGKKGSVYAFEPSGRFRGRLLDHLKRNGCTNVTVFDFGLSNNDGSLDLYGSDSTATLHPIPDFLMPIEREVIKLRTLDSLIEELKIERLDFIKVDIDGHESKFVSGAEKTFTRFRPVILMEFAQLNLMEGGSSVVELSEKLKRLGYVFYSERTGKKFINYIVFLRETMNCSHSVNVLCCPEEKEFSLSDR